MIMSLSFNEHEIIRWIMLLHNNGKPFDLDPTYSTGRFWNGIPQPKMKFDLKPLARGVVKADARALPLSDECVSSVMFDPPFIIAIPTGLSKKGLIRERFGYFRNIIKLWEFYKDSMLEFYRILMSPGIFVFKCQDCVDSGKQRMSHFEIMKYGEQIGFYCKDLFILAHTSVMWSPGMAKQQHARKNHCYFIVFQKL